MGQRTDRATLQAVNAAAEAAVAAEASARPQDSETRALLQQAGLAPRPRTVAEGASEAGGGVAGLVLAVCLVVLLWAGAGVAAAQARQQGAVSLQHSVMEAALQCFAIEGAYPRSLQHVEEDYGLTINRAASTVMYEAFAANVPPTVTVVPK